METPSMKVAFHVKHDDSASEHLRDAAARIGVTLALDQASQILDFESMLSERAAELGLVSRADIPRIRERHVLDCLRGIAAVRDEDRDALDLGSGAGLPGVLVAIAIPRLRIGLIEAKRRRVAFLEQVVERIGLRNAEVAQGRVQDLERSVDVCFARAFAPAGETWAMAQGLLRPSGRLVYFAGERFSVSDVPANTSVRLVEGPSDRSVLESSGPLVIMAKQ